MTKKELKELIHECIDERLYNNSINSITEDTELIINANNTILSFTEFANICINEGNEITNYIDNELLSEKVTSKDRATDANLLKRYIDQIIQWIKTKFIPFFTQTLPKKISELVKVLSSKVAGSKNDDKPLLDDISLELSSINLDKINDFKEYLDENVFNVSREVEYNKDELDNKLEEVIGTDKGEVVFSKGETKKEIINKLNNLLKDYNDASKDLSNLGKDVITKYRYYTKSLFDFSSDTSKYYFSYSRETLSFVSSSLTKLLSLCSKDIIKINNFIVRLNLNRG